MRSKNLWTVLVVVLTMTLFTTFAFGQVNLKAKDRACLNAIDSVTKVSAELQAAALSESGLDGNSPLVCDGKLALYQNALSHINTALTYCGMAYDAYADYQRTHQSSYLFNAYYYVSLAWNEVSIASSWLSQARDYIC